MAASFYMQSAICSQQKPVPVGALKLEISEKIKFFQLSSLWSPVQDFCGFPVVAGI